MYALILRDGDNELARAEYDCAQDALLALSTALDQWCGRRSALRLGSYTLLAVGGTAGKIDPYTYRLRSRWTAKTVGCLEVRKLDGDEEPSLGFARCGPVRSRFGD